MSKLSEHLRENSLIGRRNEGIPNKEVAEAIDLKIEEILWELEGIQATERVGKNHQKQIAKAIVMLRRLGADISKDIMSREM